MSDQRIERGKAQTFLNRYALGKYERNLRLGQAFVINFGLDCTVRHNANETCLFHLNDEDAKTRILKDWIIDDDSC
jgi:hypothetical protein